MEAEDGRFREQSVPSTRARWVARRSLNASPARTGGGLFAQMHQWHIRRTGFCVVKDRVPRAKSSARAVLTGQSNRRSFEKKRTESEQFGVMPFVGPADFKNFPAMLDDNAFDLGLDD